MNEKNKNEVVTISDSAHWVDIKTVAEIKNITSRAIRLSFSRGKYTYRETTGHGGKSYEILLSSLVKKHKRFTKILTIEKLLKQLIMNF